MAEQVLAGKPGCQTVYSSTGEVLFLGEWDSKALFAVLSGDDPLYWRGKRVLDIGANTASLSLEIARHGAAVVAIEPDPYSNNRTITLDIVENLAYEENLSLTCERAGLFEAHLFGAFDAILCLGLLYHFRDPQFRLDYLSCDEMTDHFVSTQTAPGDDLVLVNRRSSSVLPEGFLPADMILTGWPPTRPLFELMLESAGFDNVRLLNDRALNFPKKPAGLTNSAYYRATKARMTDPVRARETYYPR